MLNVILCFLLGFFVNYFFSLILMFGLLLIFHLNVGVFHEKRGNMKEGNFL